MLFRNATALVVALIPCLLAAEQSPVISFEIAMARPFGSQAASDSSSSKESNPASSPDQNYIDTNAAKAPTRKVAQGLNIYVLVGEHAVNSISAQSATSPIVEVRNERNLPVQGAEVVFQLPTAGPGGWFVGQERTWTGTTDANGQVVAADFSPNRETGPFTIRISASHSGKLANAAVRQRNALKATSPEGPQTGVQSGKRSWWKIAAIAGAGGAVGGIIWATQRSGEKPTIVLQPGAISFGGPR